MEFPTWVVFATSRFSLALISLVLKSSESKSIDGNSDLGGHWCHFEIVFRVRVVIHRFCFGSLLNQNQLMEVLAISR